MTAQISFDTMLPSYSVRESSVKTKRRHADVYPLGHCAKVYNTTSYLVPESAGLFIRFFSLSLVGLSDGPDLVRHDAAKIFGPRKFEITAKTKSFVLVVEMAKKA